MESTMSNAGLTSEIFYLDIATKIHIDWLVDRSRRRDAKDSDVALAPILAAQNIEDTQSNRFKCSCPF